MSVPFKYKAPFREVFDVIAGKTGTLTDIKEFHGYMKAPFSADVIDKHSAVKPFTVDSFFAFLAEAQKDSGLTYDEILWNFVDKFIRHQVFDGKDTMELKGLRSFYDPLFKSLRHDPEALWAKHCGAASTTATVSGVVGIIKELQPKGTPLPELLRAALPKNKPLKPAPAMRMASPRRVASTPPPAKLPASPSAAAAAAAAEKKPAAGGAGASSPAGSPLAGSLASNPFKQKQEEEAAAKKKKQEEEEAAAAKQKQQEQQQQQEEEEEKQKQQQQQEAAPSGNASTAPNDSSVSGDVSDVNPAAAAPQQQQQAQQQPAAPQMPPGAASALASASIPQPLQPTALGSFNKSMNQSQVQNLFAADQSQKSSNNNNNAAISPKGNTTFTQQQQQQQHHAPILNTQVAAPLGLPPSSNTISVPPNVAAAVNELDKQHERLRHEIEVQTAASLSADGILSIVTQRMQQLQQQMPKQQQNAKLAALRQQVESFCTSVGAELDAFRRHVPQYVSDLGRGVAAGKALEHLPNEDFGTLRLNELLAVVKKEHDEVMAKERAARRLEQLQEAEDALKKEILALEAAARNNNTSGNNAANSVQGGRIGNTNNNNLARAAIAQGGGTTADAISRLRSSLVAAPSSSSSSFVAGGGNNSPIAFVHSPAALKKQQQAAAAQGHTAVTSPALSIAQRIAARVTDQQQRGQGTANFVMPAPSSSIHAAFRAF